MFIKVIDWCSHTILKNDDEPAFYLEQDNWDDNHFKTRYYLHLSGKTTDDGEPMWIGQVKILKKGQRRDDSPLLETGKLDSLDSRFCSIGQSLDYYERIAQLDRDLRYKILSALKDIILFPEYKKGFEEEEGLEGSLLHFLDNDDDIFSLAPIIISRDFSNFLIPELTFKFKTTAMEEPIVFKFLSPEHGFRDPNALPNSICVLTGGEDSGKSEFLSKLARIAFASNEDRDVLQDEGILEPAGLGFTKIICISYSPTDTFHIPGIFLHEKEQTTRDIGNGMGRFSYCGLHDISRESEESLKFFTIDTDGRIWESDHPEDGQKVTFLKPMEALSAEFMKALEVIKGNNDKEKLLERALQFLQEESALQFIGELTFANLSEDELKEFFRNLTSSQQFVFHALTNLVLQIVPGSLVLFDEPETDLHPSLLTVLIKSIRHVLNEQNAFMIVATQSFGIIQEVENKSVSIFRREGEYIKISSPDMEKFTENKEVTLPRDVDLSPDAHPLSSLD